jgi:ribosome assembly protein YihI (activator of Der GTPase)
MKKRRKGEENPIWRAGPREATRRAESRIRTNEEEEEEKNNKKEEERRCPAVASRCGGNAFVVSSEREAKRALRCGGKPPTPPLFFSFFSPFLFF